MGESNHLVLRVFFVAEDMIIPRLFVGILILTKKSRLSQAAFFSKVFISEGRANFREGEAKP